jgi:hypothetical protein
MRLLIICLKWVKIALKALWKTYLQKTLILKRDARFEREFLLL